MFSETYLSQKTQPGSTATVSSHKYPSQSESLLCGLLYVILSRDQASSYQGCQEYLDWNVSRIS